MFFNQYDIVELGGVRYLVISVENETLLVYDVSTSKSLEIPKASCKRVNTITDIRNNVIYQASMGTIDKIETAPKVMDMLSKLNWIENAAMNHRSNAWLYDAISVMEKRDALDNDVAKAVEKAINSIKSGWDKSQVFIKGIYEGNPITIKLNLVKDTKTNEVSVNNVKRIFGDDGIFGNIKKSTVTKTPTTSSINTSRSFSGNQPNRLAS